MNPLLSVRQMSFSYDKKRVIEGMSFEVRAGETIAVVGANGSGKTTLLKILCGLLAPSKGEVLLRRRLLKDHKRTELAKCIALVPQDIPTATFDFTVREFIEQGRTPYVSSFLGSLRSEDEAAIFRAMELADVGHMADLKFSRLSGGEKQRVKIALALAQEPQLLLLDEPVQNLDIGRQAEVFSVLRRLNESGMTIIAAIHDLHSIYTHFSLALVLRPGYAFSYGSPAAVLNSAALQEVFGAHLPPAWLKGIPSSADAPDLLGSEVNSKGEIA